MLDITKYVLISVIFKNVERLVQYYFDVVIEASISSRDIVILHIKKVHVFKISLRKYEKIMIFVI